MVNWIFGKIQSFKIANANSIFADVKSIIQLLRQHFFCRHKIIWVRKTEPFNLVQTENTFLQTKYNMTSSLEESNEQKVS